MSRRNHFEDSLAALEEDGLIEGVRFRVKSGKEATVYACEPAAHLMPLCSHGLIAVKLYRPREERGFQNDAIYRQGVHIAKARTRRAVAKKTTEGRSFLFNSWMSNEANTLSTLFAAGVRVPRLIATSDNAILMDFIGDARASAPRLCEIGLLPKEATRQLAPLLAMIETMLRAGFVHGDLSPYNLLYFNEEITIIDVPQAVDPWKNTFAQELFFRDVTNVCNYFSEQGAANAPRNPERVAREMWHRLRYGAEGN